jgi:hypothetical protein
VAAADREVRDITAAAEKLRRKGTKPLAYYVKKVHGEPIYSFPSKERKKKKSAKAPLAKSEDDDPDAIITADVYPPPAEIIPAVKISAVTSDATTSSSSAPIATAATAAALSTKTMTGDTSIVPSNLAKEERFRLSVFGLLSSGLKGAKTTDDTSETKF